MIARSAAGDRDNALDRAEMALDGLDTELDDWSAYDGEVSDRSDDFAQALAGAARAERRRQAIDSVIGILEIAKGLGQLSRLADASRGVPAAAASVGSLRKRIPMGLDVAKGARTAAGFARGKPAQPSATLHAVVALKANIDAIHNGVAKIHGRRVADKSADAAFALSVAHTKALVMLTSVEQVRQRAPMDPSLAELIAGSAVAQARSRTLVRRLTTTQTLLEAMKASTPRTLAPGTGVRRLHDLCVKRPAFAKSIELVEHLTLVITVDERGRAIGERKKPGATFIVQAKRP